MRIGVFVGGEGQVGRDQHDEDGGCHNADQEPGVVRKWA